MGYRCVAYTPWMAEILRRDYGLESEWFECGTDLGTYAYSEGELREWMDKRRASFPDSDV